MARLLPIVCATDNALAVESDAPNQFVMTIQHAQTGSKLNIPKPEKDTKSISNEDYTTGIH